MRSLRVMALAAVLCTVFSAGAFAAEPEDTRGISSPEDWSISTAPPVSERQKEAARWTPLLKNDVGTYYYETSSVAPDAGNKDAATINLKVSELKPDLMVKLNAKYSYVLDDDYISHMEQKLVINRADKTFAVAGHKIFSMKGILVEDATISELKFHPIPEQSVAEAAMEIIEGILSGTQENTK